MMEIHDERKLIQTVAKLFTLSPFLMVVFQVEQENSFSVGHSLLELLNLLLPQICKISQVLDSKAAIDSCIMLGILCCVNSVRTKFWLLIILMSLGFGAA